MEVMYKVGWRFKFENGMYLWEIIGVKKNEWGEVEYECCVVGDIDCRMWVNEEKLEDVEWDWLGRLLSWVDCWVRKIVGLGRLLNGI